MVESSYSRGFYRSRHNGDSQYETGGGGWVFKVYSVDRKFRTRASVSSSNSHLRFLCYACDPLFMRPFALSACYQCWFPSFRTHQPEKWLYSTQSIARRFRNSPATNPKQYQHVGTPGKLGRSNSRDGVKSRAFQRGALPPAAAHRTAKPQIIAPIEQLPGFLRSKVEGWSREPRVMRRIESFGVKRHYIPILLNQFVLSIQNGLLERPGILEEYTLDRFVGQYFTHSNYGRIDEVLTNLFYSWVSDPDSRPHLEIYAPKSVLTQMTSLHQAASMLYPADEFQKARSIRRKFIMHVGPTNSGKTHWALRALEIGRASCRERVLMPV